MMLVIRLKAHVIAARGVRFVGDEIVFGVQRRAFLFIAVKLVEIRQLIDFALSRGRKRTHIVLADRALLLKRFDADGRELFVGRFAIDLKDEDDRTDLHAVAGRERRFLDALAIDVSAIGAAEVFNAEGVAVADEAAMLSRHFPQRNAKVAIFPPTDNSHVARHGKTPAFAVCTKHHKNGLHNDVSWDGTIRPPPR